MVYSNKDASSSDLKPVLIAVSVASAILFGGMYFFYQSSSQKEAAAASTAESPQQQVQVQSQTPAEPAVTTAVKPKVRSRV